MAKSVLPQSPTRLHRAHHHPGSHAIRRLTCTTDDASASTNLSLGLSRIPHGRVTYLPTGIHVHVPAIGIIIISDHTYGARCSIIYVTAGCTPIQRGIQREPRAHTGRSLPEAPWRIKTGYFRYLLPWHPPLPFPPCLHRTPLCPPAHSLIKCMLFSLMDACHTDACHTDACHTDVVTNAYHQVRMSLDALILHALTMLWHSLVGVSKHLLVAFEAAEHATPSCGSIACSTSLINVYHSNLPRV